MEKLSYFYFIYFIFCHFNTDSGFIFSSLLISRAEEESWSRSKVEKRVILSHSTLTITWEVLSERDLTPDSLSATVLVKGHQGGDWALKCWVLRGNVLKAGQRPRSTVKGPGKTRDQSGGCQPGAEGKAQHSDRVVDWGACTPGFWEGELL